MWSFINECSLIVFLCLCRSRMSPEHSCLNNDVQQACQKREFVFLFVLDLLYRAAKDIPVQYKLVKEKKLKRHQSKQSKQTQGKLMKLWADYAANEHSTSQLLVFCAVFTFLSVTIQSYVYMYNCYLKMVLRIAILSFCVFWELPIPW